MQINGENYTKLSRLSECFDQFVNLNCNNRERYEILEEGLFKSQVMYYVIETDTFGWKVKRKLEWFNWLKAHLFKFNPAAIVDFIIKTIFKIPPLPQKLNNSENEIKKFMQMLSVKYMINFIN